MARMLGRAGLAPNERALVFGTLGLEKGQNAFLRVSGFKV